MANIPNDLILCPMAVSANGNYYSVSSLDGQLHIWDTLSADLVADYTPSAHLSATCVRLSWAPLSSNPSNNFLNSPTKKRKRLKTKDEQDVQAEVNKLSLVALGTANGTILLYSVTQSELYSQLANGHSDRVNDIAWYPASDSIFSCSNDKYVIEWSISKSSIKSKQMLDRSVINSITVIDNTNILTASNNIKWWNWETKQLLKTFSGHSTEVRYLKPIIFGSVEEQNNVVLSSAISDRYINAWELTDSTKSNAVANFALDDEPISLELAYTSSSSPVFILSISRSGFLYIFEHLFYNENIQSSQRKANGVMMTSPIVPKIKLQINCVPAKSVRSQSKKSVSAQSSVPVPFLCAHLNSEDLPIGSSKSNNKCFLTIGYGNVNRPTFERISYSDCEKCYLKENGVLIRTDTNATTKPLVVKETSDLKIKSNASKNASDKTTVIGPAGMVLSQPLFNNINNKNGNVNNQNGGVYSEDEDDVPMEEEDEINNNYIEHSTNNKSLNSKSNKVTENDSSKEQSKQTPSAAATAELTLGEQLEQISEEEKAKRDFYRQKRKHARLSESRDQANTESLVNVLIQGLKSKDIKMLKTVLECTDEIVVRNTVKKLPVSFVPLLLSELQRGLFKNGNHQSHYLKWINIVMQVKITYLMTISNISNEFLSLNQLLTARTAILDRCFQLKGRLDIMLSQIKSDNKTDRLTRAQPKVSYESDSSDSENDDIADDEEEEEEETQEEDMLSMDDFMDDRDVMNTDDEDEEEDEADEEEEDEIDENEIAV